ncbi:MAG: hypothetical protein JW873_02855 [Candidatus Saganbacteria bacterium]|nr:hypothetical protein [Candidatus Saganbacteria bacterium]
MRKLFSLSILACSIYALVSSPALAMGSVPAKEQPKYKLEVMKMELVRQPPTAEVKAPAKSGPKK